MNSSTYYAVDFMILLHINIQAQLGIEMFWTEMWKVGGRKGRREVVWQGFNKHSDYTHRSSFSLEAFLTHSKRFLFKWGCYISDITKSWVERGLLPLSREPCYKASHCASVPSIVSLKIPIIDVTRHCSCSSHTCWDQLFLGDLWWCNNGQPRECFLLRR